jgi:hypothetical protein
MNSTEHKSLEEEQPPPGDGNADLKDFFGAFLLIAVCLAFTVAALRIPFKTSYWEWYTSPSIFTLAMAFCLGGCSIFVACRGIRRWLKNRHRAQPIHWGERIRLWGMGRFLASTAIILVYILLLGKIPFLVASVGLILILGTLFREGRFWDALRPAMIASVVIVFLAYAIKNIFGIMFP